MTIKAFITKIFMGVSTGVVVSLIPAALLGELMKALQGTFPVFGTLLELTHFSCCMMSAAVGVCVGVNFGLTSFEIVSIMLVGLLGSGALMINGSTISLIGSGDLLNTIFTLAFSLGVLMVIRPIIRTYEVLLSPTIMLLLGGTFGITILPYTKLITGAISFFIISLTKMYPEFTGILIALIFSCICISPISSVGLAMVINLTGLASGSANLGCVATTFCISLASMKINSRGITVVHFLGSPKIQLCNFIKKPIIVIPAMLNAMVLGFFAALFNIQGTAFSAGFGFSGLIGPVAAWNLFETPSLFHVFILFAVFFLIPLILAYILNYLFIDKLNILSYDDFKVAIESSGSK